MFEKKDATILEFTVKLATPANVSWHSIIPASVFVKRIGLSSSSDTLPLAAFKRNHTVWKYKQ